MKSNVRTAKRERVDALTDALQHLHDVAHMIEEDMGLCILNLTKEIQIYKQEGIGELSILFGVPILTEEIEVLKGTCYTKKVSIWINGTSFFSFS